MQKRIFPPTKHTLNRFQALKGPSSPWSVGPNLNIAHPPCELSARRADPLSAPARRTGSTGPSSGEMCQWAWRLLAVLAIGAPGGGQERKVWIGGLWLLEASSAKDKTVTSPSHRRGGA